VPVYAGQPVSAVLVPPKRLVAFTRVSLAAGQQRTVHLTFPVARLAVTPGDVNGAGAPRVEPGGYQLSTVDSASATVTVH
jgi:beta-glucosidase